MNTYPWGSTVLIEATFRRPDLTAFDPDAVLIRTRDPDGVTADQVVVHDGVGLYHAEFVPEVPGVWHYESLATSGTRGSDSGTFYVEERVT